MDADVVVRADPPFSRASTVLQLPLDVVPYKRLPPEGTFTVETIPRVVVVGLNC